MKKILKISNSTTLILCSLSIAGLVFTNAFFLMLRNRILALGNVEKLVDSFSIPVALTYLLFGFFHLSAILSLILQLHFFKRDNFLRAFLFFSGIISLLMLFGDTALVHDIVKEYMFGFPSEFYVLYFSQAIHFIFAILMLVLLVWTGKSVKQGDQEIVVKDDSVFINAQYIGILSGISGLVLITVFSLLYSAAYTLPLWALKAGISVMCFIAVVPYSLIVLYWLVLKSREKPGEWYDEKQFRDLSKSSLVTLIISVVFLLVLFILQNALENVLVLNTVWFPLYFFFVLLLFSGLILFFNKQE
jgi:hypothetical protein